MEHGDRSHALPRVLLGAFPALEPDCACPLPVPPPPPMIDGTTEFIQAPELHRAQLNEEWMVWSNPLAGGLPAVLNTAARARLAAFSAPQRLTHPADHALLAAHLIQQPNRPVVPPSKEADMLTAWMHVSNACNLECPYCYIRKSSASLTFETAAVAIDTLVETALGRGFSAIKLKYAGGEAALHYRLVQRIHDYALHATAAAGLRLREVVLSNGTVLPPAFVEWLAATGVRLMLSVDGVGAEHDRQRPWKGRGAGAFAAIERNLLERLLPRGIQPIICITLTGRSAEAAPAAVAWALRHQLPFMLNFYRENDQSVNHQGLRYEEQQIIAGMRAAYRVIESQLPAYPVIDGLLDHVQSTAHQHACGVGSSYVVITHDGKAAQCQMDISHAQPFQPGADLIALVAAGTIRNVAVDEKEGCASCLWRYRCAGGCPLVTLRATGRTDIKSPNCHIYQTLLPEAIRLEGLRLLARGTDAP